MDLYQVLGDTYRQHTMIDCMNLHNERSVAISCQMQSLQECQIIQSIGECIHLLYLDQNMGECIHLLYLDGIEQIQSIIEKQTKLYYC